MNQERKGKGETALVAFGSTLAVMTFGWALRRIGRWLDGAPPRRDTMSPPPEYHRSTSYLSAPRQPTTYHRPEHTPGKTVTQPEYVDRHEQKHRAVKR